MRGLGKCYRLLRETVIIMERSDENPWEAGLPCSAFHETGYVTHLELNQLKV